MRTRTIGSLEVSVVGVGCNPFGVKIDAEDTAAVVRAALDAGVTMFDTADVYGGGRSEEYLGQALGRHRDEVVVATKFGMALDAEHQGAHPDYVRAACDDSLRRLGTDRIDLYQLHKPDPEVPIEETLGALEELVVAGKVRELGHSNVDADELAEADEAARRLVTPRFVCSQERWNLLERAFEASLLPAVAEAGLVVLPYYPLAGGLLTGKYRPDLPPEPDWRIAGFPAERQERELANERLAYVERLEAFAHARDRSLLELAVSWLVAQPVVASVIAGAKTPGQVVANVAAGSWELEAADLAALDQVPGVGGDDGAG